MSSVRFLTGNAHAWYGQFQFSRSYHIASPQVVLHGDAFVYRFPSDFSLYEQFFRRFIPTVTFLTITISRPSEVEIAVIVMISSRIELELYHRQTIRVRMTLRSFTLYVDIRMIEQHKLENHRNRCGWLFCWTVRYEMTRNHTNISVPYWLESISFSILRKGRHELLSKNLDVTRKHGQRATRTFWLPLAYVMLKIRSNRFAYNFHSLTYVHMGTWARTQLYIILPNWRTRFVCETACIQLLIEF